MLATFVIGLREGLEAALIVGIVAAFLRQRGRSEALRLVWLGVGVAIAICVAIAVALQLWSASLPQAQQEALETVVGSVAVVMVTYMIVWMRRHARGLKRDLEDAASTALAQGTAWALIAMAFLAVMREGLETAVFLLAAFNASGNAVAAGAGATLGIVVAAGIGYGIYRGGVRLDLARFFRLTGVVLVFVAAGLVATAFHTAHEAGWVDFGQAQLLDLSAIATPGSIQAALLTGALGIQPRPTVIETVAYLLYLVPMGLYVTWPQPRRPRPAVAPASTTVATEPETAPDVQPRPWPLPCAEGARFRLALPAGVRRPGAFARESGRLADRRAPGHPGAFARESGRLADRRAPGHPGAFARESCPRGTDPGRRWRYAIGLVIFVSACTSPAASSSGAPAGSPTASSSVTTVTVTLTNAGCTPDRTTIAAGPVTFRALNDGGDKVSEVEVVKDGKILGEKENLAPGLSGTFTLELVAGDYVVACPGATVPETTLHVTAGSAAGTTSPIDAKLAAATTAYAGT